MKPIQVIALLAAFCAVDFASAEPEKGVSIAVCRSGLTDTVAVPAVADQLSLIGGR